MSIMDWNDYEIDAQLYAINNMWRLEYPIIDVFQTGQNIKKLMKTDGYTVAMLQEWLGFTSFQSIYKWFEGKSIPSTDNLYALSALFNVPIDEILAGNKKPGIKLLIECRNREKRLNNTRERRIAYWNALGGNITLGC